MMERNLLLNPESINSTYQQAYRALKILKRNDVQFESKLYILIKPWLQQNTESNEGFVIYYREKANININEKSSDAVFFKQSITITDILIFLPVLVLGV